LPFASTALQQGTSATASRFAMACGGLRIDWSPGYRVYYAMIGKTCILLLAGGDKGAQSADIERAIIYFADFKKRTEHP
jgi:putative addiction module killer protein